MTSTKFSSLGLIDTLLKTLAANGYETPTPVQERAIPIVLQGKDLLGIAQTGTGKTAAFALPILQKLYQDQKGLTPKSARALVLAPTRELAIQIADNSRIYGKELSLRITTIFGGVSQNPQIKAMQKGVDLLIATPGRLIDLMEQKHVWLGGVNFLVLDEADRMFDMGFIRDIRKVVAAVPKKRQTLMFSATMPPAIRELANGILQNPERVEVTPQVMTVERIEQQVYNVKKDKKRALLITLLQNEEMKLTIVFSKTKHGANRILKEIEQAGIKASVIHGNKSQNARQQALDQFKAGKLRVLVATDIAARGIDVDGITHVINYDLPDEPENYVHRIGRTARAGATGIAIAFCDETDGRNLRDIERTTKRKLDVQVMPELVVLAPAAPDKGPPRREERGGGRNGQPQRGRHRPRKDGEGRGDRSEARPQNTDRPQGERPNERQSERAGGEHMPRGRSAGPEDVKRQGKPGGYKPGGFGGGPRSENGSGKPAGARPFNKFRSRSGGGGNRGGGQSRSGS